MSSFAILLIVASSVVLLAQEPQVRRGVRIVRTPEESLEWLRAYAIPGDPATGKGLERLLQDSSRARIIGFGDGSHGTREFVTIKTRIIDALILERRVSVVAFEASLPMASRMSAWTRGEIEQPFDATVDHTYWFWQTREIAEFLDHVRTHNSSGAAPVAIAGVDVWDAPSLIRHLQRYLLVDPQLAAEGNQALACFSNPDQYWKERGAVRRACRERLMLFAETLAANEETLTDASSPRAFDEATETMRHLLQSEQVWAAIPAQRMTVRDSMMAENVLRLMEQSPGQVVYWAHNGHTGMAGYPDDPSIPSAGQHIRDAIGPGYFVVGTTTRSGTFRGRSGASIVDLEVPPAPEDSWENAISTLDEAALYIPLSDAPAARWLDQPRRLFVGYAGTPPGARYERLSIRDMFDALIYFDRTTPTAEWPGLQPHGGPGWESSDTADATGVR